MEPAQTISDPKEDNNNPVNYGTVDRLGPWMFDRVKPYINTKGKVLEVGSGRGDLAAVFFQLGASMYLSDNNDAQQDYLKDRFAGDPNLKGVVSINLADTNFETRYNHLLGEFDTVVALNIEEPLANVPMGIFNCSKLLRRGGYFFTLASTPIALYNGLDQGLKYWYNYNLKLINKLLLFDFEIIKARYFNIRETVFNPELATCYNKYVPFFTLEDSYTVSCKGLSVLVVGQKKEDR